MGNEPRDLAVDWPARIAAAHAVIDEALEQHPRTTHLFALFSGGHDSLVTTHVVAQHPRCTAVVHINTGIGVEQTREFVRDTCADQGWQLLEYHPPVSYREIVVEHGFPGPAGHRMMYARLKERPLRQLVRDHKQHRMDRIMLATGVRVSESARRMRHVDQVQREGAKLWVAPLYDWTKLEINAYIEWAGLRRNEVVDLIHMSGECGCGSFARPGEIDELELWFPELAAEIHALEDEVRARGIPACVWGKRPPKLSDGEVRQLRNENAQPMCTTCASERLLADSELAAAA